MAPRERLAIGAGAVLAHALLLAGLLVSPAAKAPGRILAETGEPVGSTIAFVSLPHPAMPPPASPAAVDVPPPPPPAVDPPPTKPVLIEHPENLGLPAPRSDIEPLAVNAPASPPAQAALAAPADPCGLASALQTALQNDPRVEASLALIPRPSRSVANAIMLWDGQWVAVDAVGGEASLEPIHAAIAQALGAASSDCQARANSGPLLISILEPSGATVLVLGSGTWAASEIIAQGPGTK